MISGRAAAAAVHGTSPLSHLPPAGPVRPVNPVVTPRPGWPRVRALALAASLALTAWTGLGPAPAYAQLTPPPRLPSLGEADADELSVQAERHLGDQIMREIRRDPDVVDDALVREYLDSIFGPLLAAARQRGDITPELDSGFAWEPFLVRDRSFNAFAMPGGYVGVHLGLIGASGSSDEMAAVLGHELSHVTQRHIARGMASARRQSMAANVAMLLGLILSARSSNADVPMAVIASGQAAVATGQLTFSREMEREADRFGLDVMSTAGFAPAGMASMFERMDAASRLNDSNQYPYLRSHPLTIERLSEARLRARSAAAGATPVDLHRSRPTEHALMRVRSRVLMDHAVNALRAIQQLGPQAASMPEADRLPAYYGAALASIALRDFDLAERWLSGAEAQMAARVAAGEPALAAAGLPWDARSATVRRDLLIARLELATARQNAVAIRVAGRALGEDGSRPTLMAQAEGLVARQQAGDTDMAPELQRMTERLQVWVSEHRADAAAWAWLARCAQPLGQGLRAVRAEAESRAALGDLQGAIDRLRVGQKQARSGGTDFVEASVIDSRLRELEAAKREFDREAKNSPGG